MEELLALVKEIKQQNQVMSERLTAVEQQNKALSGLVRETMNLMPYTLRNELNDFIVALTEELKSKDSGKMAESIAQLAKAMDSLGKKIDNTSLVHLQVSGTVEESLERMQQIEKRVQSGEVLEFPNGNPLPS